MIENLCHKKVTFVSSCVERNNLGRARPTLDRFVNLNFRFAQPLRKIEHFFGIALSRSDTSSPNAEVHKVTRRVGGVVGVETDDETSKLVVGGSSQSSANNNAHPARIQRTSVSSASMRTFAAKT